ncbi:ATP-binding protein [Streptomyces sp. P1-3]|uniref:ATP-binding protein n=1 Tax=Streptomyces sp. P1-3 TaxID=3421658 RepID=UPI003D36A0F4
MALVVAQEVPTSSSMAVPHGPAGVGQARRRMRGDLRRTGVPDSVIDDAVLILSELLSNACRHGRPLAAESNGHGAVRAAWRVDERARLTVEVTDGGGPTRPIPATPSVTARGGRGLNIISALSLDWGVRDGTGEVTVWAVLSTRDAFATRVMLSPEPRSVANLGSGFEGALGTELDTDLDTDLDAELDGGLRGDLGSGLTPGHGPGPGSRHGSDLGPDPGPDLGPDLGFADLDGLT